ncbi:hypothetical protein J2129_001415 [Methanofollis sp. W23]|nr:hypothetical protein [Methanofollis sp. W23]
MRRERASSIWDEHFSSLDFTFSRQKKWWRPHSLAAAGSGMARGGGRQNADHAEGVSIIYI